MYLEGTLKHLLPSLVKPSSFASMRRGVTCTISFSATSIEFVCAISSAAFVGKCCGSKYSAAILNATSPQLKKICKFVCY